MTLELTNFTGESMPSYPVKLLSADVAIGRSTVGASKPTVLALQMLDGL